MLEPENIIDSLVTVLNSDVIVQYAYEDMLKIFNRVKLRVEIL